MTQAQEQIIAEFVNLRGFNYDMCFDFGLYDIEVYFRKNQELLTEYALKLNGGDQTNIVFAQVHLLAEEIRINRDRQAVKENMYQGVFIN
jgi:hypothetical protein